MHIEITRVYVIDKTAWVAKFHLAIAQTTLGIGEIAMTFCTSDSDIEEATFLFQLTHVFVRHGTWKEIFFQTHHKYCVEFESFCRMNRHQGDVSLGIVWLLLVFRIRIEVGHQRYF